MLQDKEYFENLINSRKYWDLYSSEFHSIETDQKLLNVAEYLNLGGNLHYLISVYKRNKRIDIRNAVSQSIKFFLEKLANDDKVLLRGYRLAMSKLKGKLQLSIFEPNKKDIRNPYPSFSTRGLWFVVCNDNHPLD